jgi:hypothetical protein
METTPDTLADTLQFGLAGDGSTTPIAFTVANLTAVCADILMKGRSVEVDQPGTRSLIADPPGDGSKHRHIEPNSPYFMWYIGVTIVLVLLGGVFSGLTLGLMGLDTVRCLSFLQSGAGGGNNRGEGRR